MPAFLRGVHRGDEQAQADGEQFDVQQVDLDVAGDDDALVQDPFEEVGEVAGDGCVGLGVRSRVAVIEVRHRVLPG
ncbi:hypothetical protein AUW26_01365 [Streptomyces sp. CC71]|nr:hypothetical protein AUW26_01365 [Streptomyces sp. CC71]